MLNNLKLKQKKEPLVLIVDDIPKNLQLLANTLKDIKCRIAAATNGTKALKLTVKNKPDLILLDVMMPDMTGFEVCEKLKSDPDTKMIPIIFLTAKVETDDIIKGFEVGGIDYVTKPFNAAELKARVKTHLALKKKQDSEKQLMKMLEKSYNRLQNMQDKQITLEKRASALAMAVTASHELNQPLMVLSANIEMLFLNLDEKINLNAHKKYIDNINNSIERIKKILNKYKNVDSIDFDDYTDFTEMVIFRNQDKDQ